MVVQAIFEFFAENPPTACIAGGILLLLLSPTYGDFVAWGWGLIILGAILQVLWLIFH